MKNIFKFKNTYKIQLYGQCKTFVALILAISFLLTSCNYVAPFTIVPPSSTPSSGSTSTIIPITTTQSTIIDTTTPNGSTPTLTPDITMPEDTFTESPETTPAVTQTPSATPSSTPEITPDITAPDTTPVVIPPKTPADPDADFYFSTEGMYSLSKEHNVLIFVVDRLDYDIIAKILKKDKNFFSPLDGFTGYDNAISEFARTQPGAVHILTGYEENVYLESRRKFLDNSFLKTGILDNIKNSGYSIEFYANSYEYFGTPYKFYDLVTNLKWTYEEDPEDEYTADDYEFAKGIKNITLSSPLPTFKLYHMFGSHNPYKLNADGTKSSETTSAVEQTMGCFTYLFRYFEKMKELGVYDNSEIFIIADHGQAISDTKPLQKATAIGLFHKPSGSSNTDFKFTSAPVSHRNVPPALLRAVGYENYSSMGVCLDEVDENAKITRYFYKSVVIEKHESRIYKYAITGNALDFSNWKIIKEYDATHYFY